MNTFTEDELECVRGALAQDLAEYASITKGGTVKRVLYPKVMAALRAPTTVIGIDPQLVVEARAAINVLDQYVPFDHPDVVEALKVLPKLTAALKDAGHHD